MQSDESASSEEQIELLESQFPLAAESVFRDAYQRALAAGLSVMVSEQGQIFEIFPDGQRKFIKSIDPPLRMKPGQKFIIP